MDHVEQSKKTLIYASNGSSLTTCCLVKLLKMSTLKFYNFYLILDHEGVENVLSTEPLLRQIDKRLFLCETDVNRKENIKKSLNNIIEKEGKIDNLVCHFDERLPPKPSSKLSSTDVKDIYTKNLYPNMIIISEVVMQMKKQRFGRIISIEPIAGLSGLTFYSGYSAARFALQGYIESVAAEIADENISITSLMIAIEKKPAIYRALDRASSFHGQTGDVNNNKTLEYIEMDENKLIKEDLMKEINNTKLSNAISKILMSISKPPLKQYLNKSCENKAKEMFIDANGSKKVNEVSKFYLCVEIDSDDETGVTRRTCSFRGK